MAVERRVDLGHRLARTAAGGGSADGEGGAAALWRRLRVGLWVSRRRCGQRRQGVRSHLCKRRQRNRNVQVGVAALWRLWAAVKPRCQESILVMSTSDLNKKEEQETETENISVPHIPEQACSSIYSG